MAESAFKSQLDLLILASLAGRALHGYALIDQLRERSEGAFDLPEGTVYPVLHRLERQGLLASDWSLRNGRRAREYRLTERGRAGLTARRDAWREFRHHLERIVEGAP